MRLLFLVVFIAAMAVWCTPIFAVQTVNPGGLLTGTGDGIAGTGVKEGVEMEGNTGTLTVADQDIFTDNRANILANVAGSRLSVAVVTNENNVDSIVFNGSSNVYGTIGGGSVFNNITAGASAKTVIFYGFVNTTGFHVTGTGKVIFNSGASGVLQNHMPGGLIFDNSGHGGTVSIAPNTIVDAVGGVTTAAGPGTGTLELGENSQLIGAVGAGVASLHAINVFNVFNVSGSSNDTAVNAVTATITGAVDADSFSLGTNKLVITGALALANGGAGGEIGTTLSSPTVFGHIDPSGAASYGTALAVNVTVPSGTYIPLGTLFEIVEATSGDDGAVVNVVIVSANPLYTFTGDATANGKVVIRTTGTPTQPADPVVDPVADVVAPAVGTLPATAPVVIAINALTTADAVAKAEAQLAPSTASLASPLLTYQGVRQFQALWLNRLDGCGQVSWPSENKENCKGSTADNGWWLKGFGYFGQQDSRNGFTSYDARIIGSMIAYDRSLGANTRAGVGVGYARTNIQGTVYDANTESDSYRAVAYIGHEMGSWFFDGSGSFGWNNYRDRRHVEFPGMDTTAKAKYSGQDYTAFGRVGFHLPDILKFIITPMASLQYTRINIDGRTEKGSTNDINMNVRSQHYDYLESGLGGKVERPFNYNNKFTLVPEAHFEWLHKLSNPTTKQTAVYIDSGSAFTTPSLRTVPDSYHAGIGLNLLSCACSATVWSIETGYDYYWRTDGYAANQVSARISRRF